MKKWHILLKQENMDCVITAVIFEMLWKIYNDRQRAKKALKEILANKEIYTEIQNSICDIICILALNDFI